MSHVPSIVRWLFGIRKKDGVLYLGGGRPSLGSGKAEVVRGLVSGETETVRGLASGETEII